MSFYKEQFRELIDDTLHEIGLYSEDAVNILLGTAAQESRFGKYMKQLKNGPAKGVFQMEPATFKDIIENYVRHRPQLMSYLCAISATLEADEMVWNLKLSICMARIHYLRVPEPLPTDLSGYARYWKMHYNT